VELTDTCALIMKSFERLELDIGRSGDVSSFEGLIFDGVEAATLSGDSFLPISFFT